MSKVEKKLNHWKHTKDPVITDEIESVLDHYVPGKWTFHNTHYKITHPNLVNYHHCNQHGDFFLNIHHNHGEHKDILHLVDILEHIHSN
ncbi:MAG: hypothetical protein U0264_15360 [Candidatus Kapaibacterium sp.]